MDHRKDVCKSHLRIFPRRKGTVIPGKAPTIKEEYDENRDSGKPPESLFDGIIF